MTALAKSLAGRLLLASLLLLPLTLGVMGWTLERAHRVALDAAAAERLQLQVLALLAQADFDGQFNLPLLPLEPRLVQPNSGLYALVTDARGDVLWLSPSAALLSEPIATLSSGMPALTPGQRLTVELDGLLRHAYQVLWESADGRAEPLRFLVAEGSGPRNADLDVYRRSLLLWLGATALALLLAQGMIFAWGLRPLRELASAVNRIEAGETAELTGDWPREVTPIADNLQRLLGGEMRRRDRMRNTLADLAHSLKTPLAVLRSAEPGSEDYNALRGEQLDRMEQVIGWHLQRAAGGAGRMLQRVAVAPALQRIGDSLAKVYVDRQLQMQLDCQPEARFRGDERDLMELLGNLLDNACKYSRGRIAAGVRGGTNGDPLQIRIEDDGEGVSPDLRDVLLVRGTRADQRQAGQGIGLAVVLEIVEAQGGQLTIGESDLGGAQVDVTLP